MRGSGGGSLSACSFGGFEAPGWCRPGGLRATWWQPRRMSCRAGRIQARCRIGRLRCVWPGFDRVGAWPRASSMCPGYGGFSSCQQRSGSTRCRFAGRDSWDYACNAWRSFVCSFTLRFVVVPLWSARLRAVRQAQGLICGSARNAAKRRIPRVLTRWSRPDGSGSMSSAHDHRDVAVRRWSRCRWSRFRQARSHRDRGARDRARVWPRRRRRWDA